LPWLVVSTIGIAAISHGFRHTTHAQSQTAPQGRGGVAGVAVPVLAARARTGDLDVHLTGLGTVTALNTVTVRTRVDGQLMTVVFHEGQLVHADDLLALIDPRPFQVQLEQAEGQLARDEAILRNARLDLQRYRALAEQDAVPRQQLDTQAAAVQQAEAATATDRALISSARLNLTYARVTSPITGRVGLRLVDRGNIVHAADQNGLAVITQRRPITVVFTVPEDSLPQVLQQFRAGRRLEVQAYDRELKTQLAGGVLSSVDSQIDPATGTIKLKGTFQNAAETLFPNQFVNARLRVDTLHGVVIVPTAAIQHGPQEQTFVYVVKPDNTVEIRNVDVQITEGDQTAIARGLSAGELVVTDGTDKLQAGSKVSVRLANGAPRGSP
jgi:multidrug efflux system membrane fusion protein